MSLGLRQLLLRRAVLGGGLPPEIAADISQSTRSSHSPPPSYLQQFFFLRPRLIRTNRHTAANIASSLLGGDKSLDVYMDRWVGGSADRWIGESVLRRMAARSERAHPHQQHHQSGPRTRSTRSGNTKTHHADKSAECITSVRCSKITFGRSDFWYLSIRRFVLYGRIAVPGESKRSQGGSNSRP